MNAIGIMQGRLSPAGVAIGGRPQAFPQRWQAEFTYAKTIGFDHIEWLLTADELDGNPFWTAPQDILRCVEQSGVTVATLCADCFIHLGHDETLLARVLARAPAIGVGTVIVPWLEDNAADVGETRRRVASLRRLAETSRVRLAIESDLAAADLCRLIDRDAPSIGICYDIGNAAAAGCDVASELTLLGARVHAIHIKDRLRGGSSVPLGRGSVDFGPVADAIAAIRYRGPLILETPRGGDPLHGARIQRDFLLQHLAAVAQS